MANPIPLDLPARGPRERILTRLHDAPAEHAEAVLAGYAVLQGLYDSGTLEVLRGLFGSGEKPLRLAVEAAERPESVRIARNLLILTRMLGEIDPDLFEGFAQALPEAMQQARQLGEEPPGFWGLLKKFRSKDLRRGIVAVNNVLEAWGRQFFSKAQGRAGERDAS